MRRASASYVRAQWTPAVGRTVKPVGKPDAGNQHVRFDERGWETERLLRAQPPRPSSTLFIRAWFAGGVIAPGVTLVGTDRGDRGRVVHGHVLRNRRQRMGFEPQRARRHGRIDPDLPPSSGFIVAAMDFAMVAPTQRGRELVADLLLSRRREHEMVFLKGNHEIYPPKS